MTLKEIIDLFGKDKIFEWILEIPKFYISPTNFFRNFFKKNINEKITISIFYTLITIALTYIFSEETFKNVTKIILLEILLLTISFIILNISRLISFKIFGIKTNPENIFFFLLITKFFTLPIQIIFIILFNKTEMYEFLFIHNTIISLLFFFVIIYSSKILYFKTKQIIVTALINIILYNVFMIACFVLKFDKYNFEFENPILTDNIYKEFEEKLLPLDSLTYEYPTNKYLLIMPDKSRIIYTFKDDSINSIVNKIGKEYSKSVDYEICVVKKLKEYESLRDSLKFKRNKILYDTLVNYLKTMENDFYNPIDTSYTYLIDKKIISTEGGKYFGEIKQLSMNPKLASSYLSYLKNKNEFYNSINISDYPTYILQFILFPASKYVEKNQLQP